MKQGNRFRTDASASWPFSLPEDGWYQLAPRGRFPGKDEITGEPVLQVIDEVAIASILSDFEKKAAADNFSGLLIDYDHFSEDTDKPSVAAGWIIELQARESGIWFRARWSSEGEANLKSGCYRQISPSMEGIYIADGEVRPLVLNRAGLTNDPKFKNMRPLSNRGGGDSALNSHSKEIGKMKKLLELLGLSADASEDSAVAAVTTLKNRADEAATLKNRAETAEAALETAKAQTLAVEADAFCDANKAKIKNRDVIHARYIKDPEGTKELLDNLEVGGKAAMKNRQAKQPGKDNDENTETKAQQLEAKVQEFKSVNRCSYQAAHDAVCRANPELLKAEETTEE